MKIKSILKGLPLVALLYSCENGLDDQSLVNNTKQVSFYSDITRKHNTRAIDDSWDINDKIGVFMFNSSNKELMNANVSYITPEGNGTFNATESPLYYPEDESDVDFIAYYPYQPTVSTNYKVNVSDQSVPQHIDLMYANNLTRRNSTSVTGNLQFYHQLSRLSIQFSTSDNTDLTSINAVVKGVPTEAEYNLTNGQLSITENSKADVTMYRSGTVAQAILLPSSDIRGLKIQLTQGGNTKEITLPEEITSLEAGNNYSFTVEVKNGSSEVIHGSGEYSQWRETPVIPKAMLDNKNIYYINHYMPNDKKVRNYSALYDSDLKMSYWVAYPYCPYYSGKQDRTNKWGFDPAISSDLQIDIALGGFGGNYDRGHQLPSADRTKDYESNVTTFYSTNMTPQIGKKLNQSIWAELENQVRNWSNGTDTIFIVTGASPTASLTDKHLDYITYKDKKKVVVPKYYYKALARKVQGQFRTIAFKLDQKEYNDRDIMKYAIPVAELEQITGFTFFPTIDINTKKNLDLSFWKK